MSNRKFTNQGETPSKYRCTKQRCKWEGKDENKGRKIDENGWTVLVCPKCCNEEFYGLL